MVSPTAAWAKNARLGESALPRVAERQPRSRSGLLRALLAGEKGRNRGPEKKKLAAKGRDARNDRRRAGQPQNPGQEVSSGG